MNEKWKSQVMIYFSIYSKIKMNGFIDWDLWIKNLFSFEVVNKYKILIDDENRNDKTDVFDSLYFNEFIKLNVNPFIMLKSKDAFQLRLIDKIKFFALTKPILATKIKFLINSRKVNITKLYFMNIIMKK